VRDGKVGRWARTGEEEDEKHILANKRSTLRVRRGRAGIRPVEVGGRRTDVWEGRKKEERELAS
jgi:hypothetical protein